MSKTRTTVTATAVAATVAAELESAQAKFAPMNSGHEGWAVILEEAEELAEEVNEIHGRLPAVWQAVRADDVPSSRVLVEGIAEAAERAAVEAIQTAAMARRYLADLLGMSQDWVVLREGEA